MSWNFDNHIHITNDYIVKVAVNSLFQLIFIFPLFQIHYHTLPYPKTIEK